MQTTHRQQFGQAQAAYRSRIMDAEESYRHEKMRLGLRWGSDGGKPYCIKKMRCLIGPAPRITPLHSHLGLLICVCPVPLCSTKEDLTLTLA